MAWFSKDRGAAAVAAAEAIALEDRLRRHMSLLLEGIRLQSCHEEESILTPFNRELRQLGQQLEVVRDEADMLAIITSAIEAMKTAKRETLALWGQTREETKLLSRFLMTTLETTLGPVDSDAAQTVAGLGPEFERAKSPEDLKNLREKLEYVFAPPEVKAAKPNAPEIPIKKEWKEAEVEAETSDSPTGLRGRATAKESLKATHSSGAPNRYAVVMCLEGYTAISERFGADAAQDCLISASNYLLQSLGGDDQLFHWDRYALLGILERKGRPSDVTVEFFRICSLRPQQSICVGQRTVLASMPIKPQIISINDFPDYDELLKKIDQYARQ